MASYSFLKRVINTNLALSRLGGVGGGGDGGVTAVASNPYNLCIITCKNNCTV